MSMSLEVDVFDAPAAPAVQTRPVASRRRSALYVGGWILAALGAAGYLTVAATKPELLADLSRMANRANVAGETAAPGPVASAEEQSLRDANSRLQAEVTRLTANVIASEERAAQMAQRLAALEQPTTVAAAAAAPAPAATALAGKFAQTMAEDTRDAAPPDAATTVAGVKVINQPTSRIVTGSITPPPAKAVVAAKPEPTQAATPRTPTPADAPITFGAAVVTPAPRSIGLQIANGPSVDALRLSWTMLTESNEGLRSLEPRYVAGRAGADGGSESFDLVAGPVKSEAQAKRMCRTLKARGVSCRIAGYEGNAL